MREIKSSLHCGACMTEFQNIDSLNEHLENCIAAKTLLPFILTLRFSGEARVGHHLSHFIQSLHNNAYLIKRYTMAIVNETSSLERAKIHSAPIDEDWAIIKNRAESYTNARRNLLLLIKPIEEAANQQMHSDPK